jgi:hypothetical protein
MQGHAVRQIVNIPCHLCTQLERDPGMGTTTINYKGCNERLRMENKQVFWEDRKV